MTDYYNPFGSTWDSSCIDTGNHSNFPYMNSDEQAWIVQGLGSLNLDISNEVIYAQTNDSSLNASLVDLAGQFTGGQDVMAGHKFCSGDPWAYGPSINFPHWQNPVLAGSPAPMHPTPEGQQAIYQAIRQQAGL